MDGAFVNVVGYSKNISEFMSLANDVFLVLGLETVDVSELDSLDDRLSYGHFDPELFEKTKLLNKDNPIELGTFHGFRTNLN